MKEKSALPDKSDKSKIVPVRTETKAYHCVLLALNAERKSTMRSTVLVTRLTDPVE
jgi:hypothetical protein